MQSNMLKGGQERCCSYREGGFGGGGGVQYEGGGGGGYSGGGGGRHGHGGGGGGGSYTSGLDIAMVAGGNVGQKDGKVKIRLVDGFTEDINEPLKLTPCNKAGKYGPSAADCTAAYADAKPAAGLSFVAGETVNGVQKVKVEKDGKLMITAAGAQGGYGYGRPQKRGGYGATVSAVFTVKKGDEFQVVVGQ